MVRVAAVIPARGGSKRIPHKNIVEFCKKPMICWTIEAARDSGIFDDIWISTDDEMIKQVCKQYESNKIHIINRETCNDDHSTVSQATIATLKQLEKMGHTYDTVVQLMANCPNRGWADTRNSYDNFVEIGSKFQLSCFMFGFMNPWWAVKISERPEPLFPEALKTRSQDLPKLYCPTGAIWIADVKALYEAGTFYGPNYKMHPIPWESAVDIDDMEDLKFGETVKRMMTEEKKQENHKIMLKRTMDILNSYDKLQKKVEQDKADIDDMKQEKFDKTTFHLSRRPEGPQLDDEVRHLQKIRNRERGMLRTQRLLERIGKAMDGMGEDTEGILKLKYIDNMSIDEIAEKLNCSRRTIERKHMKLLKKMKVLLYGADALEGGET